ncbi:HNH endonuclease [Agromyces sp. SYSU K20354]|uniref:HNH endonuclease signature motif containing protein n=1 Tax=Agromyces cavernae TaxID=2898659 RepID=UPI001E60602C|nr:HNH endonuclease signature motif containing protein [Agromyces cavernae]MCD2442933.1 HNH endonuclease [Agromyces cavernae]
MSDEPSKARSAGDFEGSHAVAVLDDRSPYAIAQDGLSELIGASVQAQRVEAMNAAMRVDVLFLTVSYAVRAAEAFVAASLTPERRREMAHRAVTAELATALHVPERTMQRQLDDATALSTRLPATLAAMRDGAITMAHARVVIEHTCDLGDDREAVARLDELLAEFSKSNTAATVRRKARHLRDEVVSENLAERQRRARAKRRIEFEPAADGMAWLHAFLPAADAALIFDRLDGVARANRDAGAAVAETDRSSVRLRAELLTADQVRADAARDLLLYGTLDAASGSEFADAVDRVRPSVHVTVPVLTLMGEADTPGMLDGYGPIDADTARRLAAQAPSFTRILTHPVSGTVLDIDRQSYRPPADLARWLQVRDGTCRFPGCNRAARRSDLDHTIDWNDEGRTAFDNLAHLCAAHHHLKHETAWSARHTGAGTLEWTSPAGATHLTHAANPIPDPPPDLAQPPLPDEPNF